MILRPYQTRARAEAREHYRRGARAILMVAPTGAGKTVLLGDTIASHVKHTLTPRVNVYAHRRELIDQAARTFRALGLEVGCRGEGRLAPVQVLSTQGVLARGEVEACTLAAFDEAHHYAADLWGTVAAAHKAGGATILGATATPERADGRGLGHMFDALVTVAQPRELIAAGALVPCELVGPDRRPPRGKLAKSPAEAHCELFRGRRNVVFAPHVKAAEDFATEFVAAGISARVVEGKMHEDDRGEALAAFEAGRLEVLVNVMVLTEGWDCPPCEVVTLARGCGSASLYIQIAGRGARIFPGKTHYVLCDLAGVALEYGAPDDDRTYSLDEIGISRAGAEPAAIGERICDVCGATLDETLICGRCGKNFNLITPGSAGMALAPWQARLREDPADKRVSRLAKWMGECLAKGHKLGASGYRFKAVYGHYPTAEQRAHAERMARAAFERMKETG